MNPKMSHHKASKGSLVKLLSSNDWANHQCLTSYLKPFCGLQTSPIEPEHGVIPDFDKLALASETGSVLISSSSMVRLIIPPMPLTTTGSFSGLEVDPLFQLLNSQPIIGVILVRLGRYAVGVYEGDKLVESKTDRRYVKGRHRAGGSSANRFARIRSGQIDTLMKKVCGIVGQKFGPYEGRLEHVFLGGERMTIRKFVEGCQHLTVLAKIVRHRILDIRTPSQDSLLTLGATLWQSDIYTIEY